MNEISDINSITITGYLKDDPELATSSKNTRYATFIVINSQINQQNQKENLSYFKIVAFGEVNCSILSNMYKNDKILVKGKLDQQLYRDKNNVTKETVKIMASNIYKISAAYEDKKISYESQQNMDFVDDEIPF